MNNHKQSIIEHFRNMDRPKFAVGDYVCLRTFQSRVGEIVKIINDNFVEVKYFHNGPALRENIDWIIKAPKPDTIG